MVIRALAYLGGCMRVPLGPGAWSWESGWSPIYRLMFSALFIASKGIKIKESNGHTADLEPMLGLTKVNHTKVVNSVE